MPALDLKYPSQEDPQPVRHDSGMLVVGDRAAEAAAAVEEAEDLLSRDLLEQAGERFMAASRAFDDLGDAAGSARALLGLGKVLLGLEDPACREVLEDAGTTLEDLGDEAKVLEIDRLLRAAEASIQESPRSFAAGRRPSTLPPPR